MTKKSSEQNETGEGFIARIKKIFNIRVPRQEDDASSVDSTREQSEGASDQATSNPGDKSSSKDASKVEPTTEGENSWRIIWKISGVLVACYLPPLLIVMFSVALFKPASTLSQANKQPSQALTQEQIDQINKKVKEELESQPKKLEEAKQLEAAVKKLEKDSIVAQGYIDRKIEKESNDQAVKAVEDKTKELKGDLFSQITLGASHFCKNTRCPSG
jgi:hypothetical protein